MVVPIVWRFVLYYSSVHKRGVVLYDILLCSLLSDAFDISGCGFLTSEFVVIGYRMVHRNRDASSSRSVARSHLFPRLNESCMTPGSFCIHLLIMLIFPSSLFQIFVKAQKLSALLALLLQYHTFERFTFISHDWQEAIRWLFTRCITDTGTFPFSSEGGSQ